MFFAAMLIVDFYLWSVFSAKLQTFTKPLLVCNCCMHFVIVLPMGQLWVMHNGSWVSFWMGQWVTGHCLWPIVCSDHHINLALIMCQNVEQRRDSTPLTSSPTLTLTPHTVWYNPTLRLFHILAHYSTLAVYIRSVNSMR